MSCYLVLPPCVLFYSAQFYPTAEGENLAEEGDTDGTDTDDGDTDDANDGDPNSCMTTKKTTRPWWSVDMGGVKTIRTVKITAGDNGKKSIKFNMIYFLSRMCVRLSHWSQ